MTHGYEATPSHDGFPGRTDSVTAGPLHADDFRLVTPPGVALSKAEYLDAAVSGEIGYRVWEITSAINVRPHGEAAAIRYRSRIDMEFEGVLSNLRCWHTDTYEHREGRWHVVWSHATAVR